jgi:DNA-binding GntR family transcriptional regulator
MTRPHWPYWRRILGEVLRGNEGMPRTVSDEHAAILDAIIAGGGDRAENSSREHVSRAADFIIARLQSRDKALREEHRT